MVNKVPYIYVCRENREDAWKIVDLLLKNGYDTSVKEEEGAVIIKFDNADQEIAEFYNVWLTGDECDMIDDYRFDKEHDDNKPEN